MHRWPLALALLCLSATACGSGSASSAGGSAVVAQDQPAGADLTVVAAVYPFAWLAERVAPGAEVDLLNRGGLDAHDLDLSPQQRAVVETADVVLYTGDIDYQPQVEEAVSAAQGQVVSAAEVAGDDALLTAGADAHAHDDAAHGEEAGEEEHSYAGAAVDPHLWFSPAVMAEVALATGRAFASADPAEAASYERNAAEVAAELDALGADLEAMLGGACRFEEAIVSHAAYSYLLQPFGKGQHAVTGVGAEDDASAAELAEIVDEVRTAGFTHVLAEPVEGRDGAEAVVRETGVQLLEVLPLEAVAEDQEATGLPDLVRAQATAFATALGCE